VLKVIGWRLFKVSLVLLGIGVVALAVVLAIILWLVSGNDIDEGRAASLVGPLR
jgi:hypothetical protein